MAAKKEKITLTQLIAEKGKWSYCYSSAKYQYYIDSKFEQIVKIKKSIVLNYLENNRKTIIPFNNVIGLAFDISKE